MRLTIIRGLPGSGKTTVAKTEYPEAKHCEADQYFEDGNGNYNFDPGKLKDAHEVCQKCARDGLESGKDVVVSNTFTQCWEMEPYIDMADDAGADVEIRIERGDYGNVHDVPEYVILAMKNRFEKDC